jgi:hypothetical protein
MFAPRRSTSATPATDPELAGPHPQSRREAVMFSLIHSELGWLALTFILSMVGMMATYVE